VGAVSHGGPIPAAFQTQYLDAETLLIRLSGGWRLRQGLPDVAEVERQIASGPQVRRIVFDAGQITAWDTGLLTFLHRLLDQAEQQHIDTDLEGLPLGAQRLLRLAAAVPEEEGGRRRRQPRAWLARVGQRSLDAWAAGHEMVGFVGEACLAALRFCLGKAYFRGIDLGTFIQDCGARALPIVTLISFLVGLILAFMGAVQLRQFGAQIYVADLVGLGMTREMGAIMTGVIMAGRTGAAFAAQLGAMRANEEIDALTTLGISPIEFLVLPRMLALVFMMPLLCVYADIVGMAAGGLVATTLFHLSPVGYVIETQQAVDLVDCALGIFKSAVFGVLIALAGCLRGMQCERSASAVGAAATSAVVTSIVWIVASDGLFAVLSEQLGL
jgi:phospholipid/cholesterol/gamma-HCH transport system permease protein